MRSYFELAFENLKKRRLRSLLTVIGIVIGITAVVSLIALGQGLEGAVSSRFVSLGSDKLIIQAAGSGFGPPGTDVINKLTVEDQEEIDTIRGVKLTGSRLLRAARIEHKDDFTDQFIASYPVNQPEVAKLVVDVAQLELAQGRFPDKGERRKIFVGESYHNGAIFDAGLRDRFEIQGREFEVIGLLEKKGFPIDDAILMTESDMRDLFDDDDFIDILIVQITSGADIDAVQERIEELLRKRRDVDPGKEDFEVQSPQQILDTLGNILFIIKAVVYGIAFISLFVGGIGIMNTMYTAVLQRTREIGILKAIGARNSTILLIFVFESGLLGMIGGCIGVLFGILFSKLIEQASTVFLGSDLLQATISPTLIIGALLFSFTMGCISGVVPAYRASKLKPVESLRYE